MPVACSLTHVANEDTTNEESLLAALANTPMDEIIGTLSADVESGGAKWQYVKRCQTFMTYTGIDAAKWQTAVDNARAEAHT